MRQWLVFLSIILSAWPQTTNAQNPLDTTGSSSSTAVTIPTSISTFLTTDASASSSASTTPSTSPTIPTSPISGLTPTSTSPTSALTSDLTTTPTDTTGSSSLSSTSATTYVPESSISTSSSASTTLSTPSTSPTSPISESTTTFTSHTSVLTSDSTSTSTDTTANGTSSSTSATTSVSGTTPPASSTPSTPSETPTTPTTTPPTTTTPKTTTTPTTTTTPSTTPTTTPAPTPILAMNDDTRSVEWNPKSSESVIIEAEEGYKIAVTILDCNIDGTKGELATIESGIQGEGLLFTYKVKSKPSYLFNNNVLYADYGGKGTSIFHANFSRVGEHLTTTTTEITSSTQFVPTPSAWNSSTITVFLSGKNAYEYQKEEVINKFRDDLRKMATEYCSDQNFHLAEKITINNVVIRRVDRCPAKWPEYETCAKITFGIPIVLENNAVSMWKGYQLNEFHLKIMWDRYHKKYIDDDFVPFVIPNVFKWVKWEIIVFCGITVAIMLLLLVLKHIYVKYTRRSKEDDTEEIISSSNDDYGVSLTPHPLQEYPPIFEMTYQDISLDPPSFMRSKDERDDLLSQDEKETLSKIDLVEESLGESGA